MLSTVRIQRFSKVTHWLFRGVGGYNPLKCLAIAKRGHNLSEVRVAQVEESGAAYAVATEAGHGLVAKGIVLLEEVTELLYRERLYLLPSCHLHASSCHVQVPICSCACALTANMQLRMHLNSTDSYLRAARGAG